jgi:hypothetical protein
LSSIGQEGDDRKYRKLRKSDYYESKAAFEADVAKVQYCKTCGREIGESRMNRGGYCFLCQNE